MRENGGVLCVRSVCTTRAPQLLNWLEEPIRTPIPELPPCLPRERKDDHFGPPDQVLDRYKSEPPHVWRDAAVSRIVAIVAKEEKVPVRYGVGASVIKLRPLNVQDTVAGPVRQGLDELTLDADRPHQQHHSHISAGFGSDLGIYCSR